MMHKEMRVIWSRLVAVLVAVAMLLGFGLATAQAVEPSTGKTDTKTKHNAIVLVLDSSGSMSGDPFDKGVRPAAKKFIEAVFDKDPLSQIAVVSFGDTVHMNPQGFTNDEKSLVDYTQTPGTGDDKIWVGGGTNVTLGLQKADELGSKLSDDDYVKSIVTMSDGWPNDASGATAQAQSMFPRYNMYSVGFNIDDRGRAFLKTIQNKGDDGYYDATDIDTLIKIFGKIVDQILHPLDIALSYEDEGNTVGNGRQYLVTAKLSNPNTQKASSVKASISFKENAILATGEQAEKTVGEIPAKDSRTVSWRIRVVKTASSVMYTVTVSGDNMADFSKSDKIAVGNNTGTSNVFDFDKDTWKFGNYREDVVEPFTGNKDSNVPVRNLMSNEDFDRLIDSVNDPDEFANIMKWSQTEWAGSCYGFAATSILAKMGSATPYDRQSGASSLHDMNNSKSVISYINYYYLSQQYKAVQSVKQESTQDSKDAVSRLLADLDQVKQGGAPVLLFFSVLDNKKSIEQGRIVSTINHVVVADSYSETSYAYDGHSFNYAVRIYDSNMPNNANVYLYVNKDTGDWYFPGVEPNVYGAKSWAVDTGKSYFPMIINDLNILNPKEHDLELLSKNYFAQLNAHARTNNADLLIKSGASQWSIDKILRDKNSDVSFSFPMDGAIGNDFSFNLPNNDNDYSVETKGQYDYALHYPDAYVAVKADKADSATFSRNGNVALTGNSGKYTLSSTLDSAKGPWFTYSVSGSKAKDIKLTKNGDGYIVEADNLTDARFSANNKEETKTLSVDTSAKKVEVKADESGRNLVASIDKDGDGKFETVIADSSKQSVVTVEPKAPSRVGNTVSIPSVKGVSYVDGQGKVLKGDVVLHRGETLTVKAQAQDGYKLQSGVRSEWTFTYQDETPVPNPEPSPSPTPTPTPSPSVTAVPVYRVYDRNSGLHHYTTSRAERDHLVRLGWRDEGVSFKAAEKDASNANLKPVYREYNPNDGNHNWTMSRAEHDHLVRVGWRDEGVAWYVDSTASADVYRLYNPNSGEHVYTTSKVEYENVGRAGWHKEGVAWKSLD
ncbi:VWA domain-containing protein [Bifidobacterium callitrichos]|uniref:VWA domain-containing protein n=1 Tax=Bifidobacterium callitrichos TaxID=762209 RepID=UPI0006900011|nr:VWA domain-containing protein [Bifidobacterium callitrichos]